MFTGFVFLDILKHIPKWSWDELEIGLKIGYITYKDIIEYAKHILDDNTEDYTYVLDLAIAEKNDDISGILNKLVTKSLINDEEIIVGKWRYAILLQLFINRDAYENVYQEIAKIDADFNHPKDMRGFIYYRPFDGTDMETNWRNYLKDNSKIYGNNYSL